MSIKFGYEFPCFGIPNPLVKSDLGTNRLGAKKNLPNRFIGRSSHVVAIVMSHRHMEHVLGVALQSLQIVSGFTMPHPVGALGYSMMQ